MPEQIPILEWMASHRDGRLASDLTDAMRTVLDAVAATGRAGSVTLTVKVDRQGTQFLITDTVTAKAPREAPESRIYWLGADGLPSRSNPMQPQLIPMENQ